MAASISKCSRCSFICNLSFKQLYRNFPVAGWRGRAKRIGYKYIYRYICGYTYTRTCRHVKYITHICRPIYTYIHIYIYIFICSVSLFFILVTVVDAPVGALQPTRPYRYSIYQIVVEAEAAPSPPFASGSSDGD